MVCSFDISCWLSEMSKYTASEANGEKRIAFLNRRIIYLNILCAEQVRKLLAASFCESLVKIA